ncbi:unnamed protein product [Clonostachys byssicola]|uniref:Uncharacterized protein n=1 Tax=Clonostachys byssicola TaxID=160290 RepID=A0A9N9Y570_9HYPO|nr:unnamed protein product [Clonostachys byssicola]
MFCDTNSSKVSSNEFSPVLLVSTVAVVLDVDRILPKPNDGGALSIIVSIPKITLVEEHPAGTVDQLIDYKTRSVNIKGSPNSVDVSIVTLSPCGPHWTSAEAARRSYNAYDWDIDKGDNNGPDRS